MKVPDTHHQHHLQGKRHRPRSSGGHTNIKHHDGGISTHYAAAAKTMTYEEKEDYRKAHERPNFNLDTHLHVNNFSPLHHVTHEFEPKDSHRPSSAPNYCYNQTYDANDQIGEFYHHVYHPDGRRKEIEEDVKGKTWQQIKYPTKRVGSMHKYRDGYGYGVTVPTARNTMTLPPSVPRDHDNCVCLGETCICKTPRFAKDSKPRKLVEDNDESLRRQAEQIALQSSGEIGKFYVDYRPHGFDYFSKPLKPQKDFYETYGVDPNRNRNNQTEQSNERPKSTSRPKSSSAASSSSSRSHTRDRLFKAISSSHSEAQILTIDNDNEHSNRRIISENRIAEYQSSLPRHCKYDIRLMQALRHSGGHFPEPTMSKNGNIYGSNLNNLRHIESDDADHTAPCVRTQLNYQTSLLWSNQLRR